MKDFLKVFSVILICLTEASGKNYCSVTLDV